MRSPSDYGAHNEVDDRPRPDVRPNGALTDRASEGRLRMRIKCHAREGHEHDCLFGADFARQLSDQSVSGEGAGAAPATHAGSTNL